MKHYLLLYFLVFIILGQTACQKTKQSSEVQTAQPEEEKLDPFAANNGIYPPDSVYQGPFFEANYDYPTQVPQGRDYPWDKVLEGGVMTKANASPYIMAVRDYIAEDMRLMINEPELWLESENKKNWYNMGWSAQNYDTTGWEGLETVYGTMTGQVIKNDIFTDYGFTGPMQNHALVYYNDVAAVTLNQLWKSQDTSGFYPDYRTEAAQFKQNAIIIKAAGTTTSAEEWPALQGAGTFPIYREASFGPEKGKGPVLQELTWIQFDIIIKDTMAAPETGWVFSTFIYDASSNGATTFDRLNLLGVSWGNDPERLDTTQTLEETYLNPNAPDYYNATIGYGGRLAGPIDVAVVGGTTASGEQDSVYILNPEGGAEGGQQVLHYTASACMSCHGTASWPAQNDFYPSPVQKLVYSDSLYNPKSKGWANYYQNRSGDEIMPTLDGKTKSTMALDYDLFMQFALNNSMLGHHTKPKHAPKEPEGYNTLDLSKHPVRFRPKSK